MRQTQHNRTSVGVQMRLMIQSRWWRDHYGVTSQTVHFWSIVPKFGRQLQCCGYRSV